MFEAIWIEPTHSLKILFGKLERAALEADSSWCSVEDKGKVNMENWTIIFNHYITVISIFDIQQILCQTEATESFSKSFTNTWYFYLRILEIFWL